MEQEDYFSEFFTATIYKWIQVLIFDECKDIIINSLAYLVKEGRVKVYSFVIMPNHIHLIWRVNSGHNRKDVQRDFLRFTGQQIKFYLEKHHSDLLQSLLVNLKDRTYQIWQRNSLSIELYTESVFEQKLDYIHNNPCQEKWKLALTPSDYKYSSAKYYMDNIETFTFLSHYK